jgi:alpha-methylacyl-CoA racemase
MWGGKPGHNVLDTGAPFYEVYECADGRHLAVGALEPAFYDEFTRLRRSARRARQRFPALP